MDRRKWNSQKTCNKRKDLTSSFHILTTFKRRLRSFSFLSSIFGLQTVLTHSTYNSFTHVTTVRGGHDCRTFFCVAGTGSIFIHTVDGDSVNAIHITIVCTAVLHYTAISSCKRVDGTSFTATLGLNKGYIYILATKTSLTISKEETHLVESVQCLTSHHYWQKP